MLLYARALEVLEQADAAVEWLHAPSAALDAATPLSAVKGGPGAERALAILGRIEHGVLG